MTPYTIIYTNKESLDQYKPVEAVLIKVIIDKLNSTTNKAEVVKLGKSLTSTYNTTLWS